MTVGDERAEPAADPPEADQEPADHEPGGPEPADDEPGGPGLWWRLPGSVRLAVGIVAIGVVVAFALTLREPSVGVELPARDGQHLHDAAGVVDADAVEQRLAALERSEGVDAVAVVWEDEQASLGQAARGATQILDAWQADVALSAVAHPGAFTDQQAGRRFFGVEGDRFEVGSGLRERIVEDVVPAPAGENDWTAALLAAIDEIEAELGASR